MCPAIFGFKSHPFLFSSDGFRKKRLSFFEREKMMWPSEKRDQIFIETVLPYTTPSFIKKWLHQLHPIMTPQRQKELNASPILPSSGLEQASRMEKPPGWKMKILLKAPNKMQS